MKSNQSMKPEELLAFLKRHKLNQKDLAELLGVNWQAVRFWERGERSVPETTARLLRLFDKYPQLIEEF